MTPSIPLEDKNALSVAVALTVASLAVLLPADHLAARETLTPINAADQGVTAVTKPKFVDATKALPICPTLIKPIRTRLPDAGWQEANRKTKKVSVPSNAISRVIGRGGRNINAIRKLSGAHIEV